MNIFREEKQEKVWRTPGGMNYHIGGWGSNTWELDIHFRAQESTKGEPPTFFLSLSKKPNWDLKFLKHREEKIEVLGSSQEIAWRCIEN